MEIRNSSSPAESLDKSSSKWAIIIILSVVLGVGIIWFSARQTDREMRADLLQRTQLVAESINIERIEQLTGTVDDLGNPTYLRLKKQLSEVCSNTPQCRFLYLMGRKADGSIFFFVDSEPPDSTDYSPPGQAYTEVSDNIRDIFSGHTPKVEGPESDRWGTWITGLVPLHNPQMVLYGLSTPENAQKLVQQAEDYYRAKGRESLLKEVNNPNGIFCKGDLYAFIYDSQMTMLAHPMNIALVGKNLIDKKDWAGGTYFRKLIQNVAISEGSGWVDYEYENPINKQRDPKTTYVKKVDDFIICAGAYKGTGPPVAVLGMDVKASYWHQDIVKSALPSIIFTLAIIALIISGKIFITRRTQYHNDELLWTKNVQLILVIAAGCILTGFTTFIVHAREVRNRNESFKQLAQIKTESIASIFYTLRNKELESLARFHAGSENVTFNEFHDFTEYLTRNHAISAWAWIPTIKATDKDKLDTSFAKTGVSDFKIWQLDESGKQVPSSCLKECYPIFYIAPLEGNERALGYDISSAPKPRAALSEASITGLATATEPLTLVQEVSNQRGMVVYLPVYENNSSRSLKGVVAAGLRMGHFLGRTDQSEPIILELSLLGKGEVPDVLATSWTPENQPDKRLLSLTRPVLAFGKVFGVSAHAGPAFMKMHPMRSSWLTLFGGAALTAAFSFITWTTLRRKELLERLVTERTVELQNSEERFKALHNASFGGIAMHDQGTIFDCNQGLSDLTGYTLQELVGIEVINLVSPDSRDRVKQHISKNDEQFCEAEGLRKDGTVFPLILSGSNVPYKERTVSVSEFRDITDLKQAEKERKELHDQLLQSQKMEALGALAGGIAHDFNNILSGILGFAELARNTCPNDSKTKEYLDKELDAIHRASSLVKQILAFSRKGLETKEPVQPAAVIKEGLNLLRASLPTTIEIHQKIDPNCGFIIGNPTNIHQVLVNLCTNALHAMDDEKGSLIVSLSRIELAASDLRDQSNASPGPFIVLSISDTGCGMDPKTRERIFEPYFTTKDASKGTGMGLGLVHKIVQDYGGFIKVESELDRGSTFQVFFPAIVEVAANTTENVNEKALPRGNERILVVDDEESIIFFYKEVLEDLGYSVDFHYSSEKALEMIRYSSGLIDLVISDQTMPSLTGFDLSRKILNIRKNIPIILCTGHSNMISEDKIKEIGIARLLMKPLSRQELAVNVRKVIDEYKKY